MSRREVVFAAASLVVLGAACGGPGQVDTREVERGLLADFVVVEGVGVDEADCPNQVDRAAGGSFVCSLRVDGQELDVRVVQVDDDGTVRFEQQQSVFATEQVTGQVAREVGRELGQLVTATCATSTVIVVEPDETLTCDVIDENGSTLRVVAEVGDEGVLSVTPA